MPRLNLPRLALTRLPVLMVTAVPPDLRSRLAACENDVAGVTLWSRTDLHAPQMPPEGRLWVPCEGSETNMRVLLRALPGLRVEQAHHVYTDGQQVLRSNFPEHILAPALDCNDLRIEHRQAQRAVDRQNRSRIYYRTRDAAGLEAMSLAV